MAISFNHVLWSYCISIHERKLTVAAASVNNNHDDDDDEKREHFQNEIKSANEPTIMMTSIKKTKMEIKIIVGHNLRNNYGFMQIQFDAMKK